MDDDHTMPDAPFDLETVFEVDDYLFFYGHELTDERADAEVEALVWALALDSPMKILDLACGFGRHANRLAALGHHLTGLDLMPGFLALARQDAAARGVSVDYRQGDMRRLDFVDEFDRVLLLFTSFGYFGDDDNARVVHHMARALKPGGLLMFDIPNRDVVAAELPRHEVIDKDGDLLINRLSFDATTRRFHNQRILVRDGLRKDKPFSIRLYNPAEVRDLLDQAGLELDQMLSHDGQPFSDSSPRMVVIARKPREATAGPGAAPGVTNDGD
jgi:SAM-dependent methyltransferase